MTQQPPPAQAPIGCMMPLQAYLEERNQHLCQQYGAYPQLQRHQGFQYNATTTPHNMSQLPTDASPVGCMKPLEAFIQHLRQKNGAQPKPLQHQGFQYNPQAHAFLSYPALWEWDSFAYSKNAAYSYIPVLAANGYQVQAQSAPVNPATPAAAMYQAWPSQQHYGQGGYSARPGAQQQQGLTSQPFPDPHVYQKPRHMPSPFPGSERFRPAYMAGHISQPAPSQPLTGAPLGPPDRRQYGPSHAMQPLSLFVQQMPAYDREYPASPGFSRLHQAPQQATSFGPRHVLGVHPQQAASFVPPHRKPFGQDVASQNESQELTEKENASPTSFVAGVPVSNGEGAHYGRNTIDLLAASTGEGDHYEMNTEDLLASSTQHMVDSDGQHPEAPTLSKPPSATVAVTTFTQDVDSDTKSAPTPDTIRGRRKDPHTNELIRQLEQPFASKADMWHSVSPVEPQVADDQPENAVEYESPPQQQSSSLESLKKEQPEQTAAKERNKRNRNRNRNNRRNMQNNTSYYNRSATDTSTPSPPNKRLRESPPSSPAFQPIKVGSSSPAVAPNPWANFFTLIKQDDRDMIVKSREARERVGEAFRPGIQETYKDQKGIKEVAHHEKVPGKEEINAQAAGKENAKEEVREETADEATVEAEAEVKKAESREDISGALSDSDEVEVKNGELSDKSTVDKKEDSTEDIPIGVNFVAGVAEVIKKDESSGEEDYGGVVIDIAESFVPVEKK